MCFLLKKFALNERCVIRVYSSRNDIDGYFYFIFYFFRYDREKNGRQYVMIYRSYDCTLFSVFDSYFILSA